MAATRKSNIDNPFKERHIPWTRYLILLSVALILTIFFVISDVAKVKASQGKFQPNLAVNKNINKDEAAGDDDNEDSDKFPDMSLDEYPDWLHEYLTGLEWDEVQKLANTQPGGLNKDLVRASLQMGCANLRHNQKEEGNFNYQYDFVEEELDPSDNQVRNVGALWGLALCFQHFKTHGGDRDREYTDALQQAVEKGLDFFLDHLIEGPVEGSLLVKYPGTISSETGTNAILGLALVDYIHTLQPEEHGNAEEIQNLRGKLDGIIKFLVFLQLPNKHFSSSFQIQNEIKTSSYQGYFDGETILCLTKAAKYIPGYEHLIPLIEQTAPVLAKSYTVDAWREEVHDSPTTKGFYQWSSMLASEYYDAKWKNFDLFGDYVLVMAHWIVSTHSILTRNANTGYAYEGIISAYEVAQARDDDKISQALKKTIDVGLYKLSTWQVGGPLSNRNPFLKEHPTTELIAVGGVMNHQDRSPLRIDTTQHQMHAYMMAFSSVYR